MDQDDGGSNGVKWRTTIEYEERSKVRYPVQKYSF